MDGGSTFRARFGVERNGETLLAEGSYTEGLGAHRRLSRVHHGRAEEARLGRGPDAGGDWRSSSGSAATTSTRSPGRPTCRAASSASRSSTAAIPYGNGKARAVAWNLPDPVPVHREPIYTPRADLVAKYPTLPDAAQFRLPNIGFTVQKAAVDKGIAKDFPIILTSGRLVEYEGGGEETRSNRWLAELQQDMFVEINPADAAERGISDGAWVWVIGAENNVAGAG